jgi:hypothetical protein
MPGTLFTLELDEAVAVVAAVAADPAFPEWCSDTERQALVTEARRVVEQAANEAATRCLAPARAEPCLKVVQGGKGL